MKLLIHTPISNRAWILPEWLDRLKAQDVPKEDTVVCFDVNESQDDTSKMVTEFARQSRGVYADVLIREFKWPKPLNMPDHVWSPERYRRMTQLRNGGLYAAEKLKCDFLFSIDSDVILTHPQTLSHLMNANLPIIAGVFMAVWGNPEASALPNVWERGQNEMSDDFIEHIARAPHHVKVGGLGACTLIRHDVWESGVTYTPIYNAPSAYRGEDRHFCTRAVAAGFDLMACSHALIEHRDKPKIESEVTQ